MSLGLLLNTRLRRNYKQAINIKTKEECDIFFDELSMSDKAELISYIEHYDIPQKKRTATPTNEYVLLHYKDYLSTKEIQDNRNADRFNAWVAIFYFFLACILTYFTFQ